MTPELFAPAARLSSTASFVVVYGLFGIVLVVAAVAALRVAFRAFVEARTLAGSAERGLLHAGPTLLTGVVRALAGAPAGPLVELTVVQHATPRDQDNGGRPHVDWDEHDRTLVVHRFALHTQHDAIVEVHADQRIELVDRFDATRNEGRGKRARIAQLTDGESVWIRGVLRPGAIDGDPYRGGGEAHWVLEPDDAAPLVVSSRPLGDERRSRMIIYAGLALLTLACLVLTQALLFADYRALHGHGVVTQAKIRDRHSWESAGKTRIEHYEWNLRYDTPAGSRTADDETNADAFAAHAIGSIVPVTYAKDAPDIMEVGTIDELGVSHDTLAAMMLLVMFVLAIVALRSSAGRRKRWSGKGRLDEQTQGGLPKE